MNHAQFAEHTEHYVVNGARYSATANFVSNILIIKSACYYNKISLDMYSEFAGNMEEFVTSIVENS